MKNIKFNLGSATRAIRAFYKSSFFKLLFAFVIIMSAGVGAYTLLESSGGGGNLQKGETSGNSFFSSAGNAVFEALGRVFGGGASGSRFVEVIDVNKDTDSPESTVFNSEGTTTVYEAPPGQDELPQVVNINTAGPEELQEITGVGNVIAQRIIDYREVNGPFLRIEDIKNVSGIGEVNFEKMRSQITVGG